MFSVGLLGHLLSMVLPSRFADLPQLIPFKFVLNYKHILWEPHISFPENRAAKRGTQSPLSDQRLFEEFQLAIVSQVTGTVQLYDD